MESKQLRAIFVLSLLLGALLIVLNYAEPPEEPEDERTTLEVWKLEREDVQRLAFESEGHPEVAFQRGDDDKWQIVAPDPGPADGRAVDSALWDLVRNNYAVPIEGAVAADFGLEPPRTKVTLIDNDDKAYVLEIGMNAPVGYQTYVRTPSGTIGAVDGQFGDTFTSGVDKFRDKRAFRYEVGDVVRASITSEQGVLEVSKVERDWWLTGYAHADLDKVDDLLTGMLDLRFDVLMPPPSEGLISDPRYDVQVELEDGSLHRVQIGDRTPMGTFALAVGVTAGMIDGPALSLLAQGPPDLAEDHAFPIKARFLERVDVQLGDVKWSLEKDGALWKQDGEVEDRSDAALTTIAKAGVHLRPEPVPELSEVWGTVVLSEDVRVRTIDIGQREGARWRVAKDREGGEPYLIPVADLDAVMAAFTGAAGSDEPAP